MSPIFTLNARGHIMLEVMRDHFKLTALHMRKEIQAMHRSTVQVLATKGVAYETLRSGLTPLLNRHEAGFIFDSSAIRSSWYGREVMRQVLPLLGLKSTQSVLCGDLLGEDQRLIYEILSESMELSRSFEFRHGTLLFCVYVNNMSAATLSRLHQSLAAFPAYVGYIPATFGSRAKTYLSTCLINTFVKTGNRVIAVHEDDRSNEENVNLSGYPFEDFGYKLLSLQETYFGIFLSFKIERPVFRGFEFDSEMALNSISDQIVPLHECTVLLEEAKHGYLLSEKAGKLQKAQLAAINRNELVAIIKSKLAANYIYNMTFLPEHDVMKFNLMIEIERDDGGYPTRLASVFEYRPDEKTIRLITLH